MQFSFIPETQSKRASLARAYHCVYNVSAAQRHAAFRTHPTSHSQPGRAQPSPARCSNAMTDSCRGRLCRNSSGLTPDVHVIGRKSPNWVIPSPPSSPSSSFTFWWYVMLSRGTNDIIYFWSIIWREQTYPTAQQFNYVSFVVRNIYVDFWWGLHLIQSWI